MGIGTQFGHIYPNNYNNFTATHVLASRPGRTNNTIVVKFGLSGI